jgi:hypothetical protein
MRRQALVCNFVRATMSCFELFVCFHPFAKSLGNVGSWEEMFSNYGDTGDEER